MMMLKRRNATFVESVIVMMLLCLILFGLLQLVHVGAAKLIAEYAAFNTVRSGSVGFRKELVERSAVVASLGALSTLKSPDLGYDRSSPVSQFGSELNLIPRYMEGEIWWLSYKYSHLLDFRDESSGPGMRRGEVVYKDFPFEFPMWQAFSLKPSIDLKGEAQMIDHASIYLEY